MPGLSYSLLLDSPLQFACCVFSWNEMDAKKKVWFGHYLIIHLVCMTHGSKCWYWWLARLSHPEIILWFSHWTNSAFFEAALAQQNILPCAVSRNFPWLILPNLWNCPLYFAFCQTDLVWFNIKTNWIFFSMSCWWTSTKSFSQYPVTCCEELTMGFFLRKPFHILLRCKNNSVH